MLDMVETMLLPGDQRKGMDRITQQRIPRPLAPGKCERWNGARRMNGGGGNLGAIVEARCGCDKGCRAAADVSRCCLYTHTASQRRAFANRPRVPLPTRGHVVSGRCAAAWLDHMLRCVLRCSMQLVVVSIAHYDPCLTVNNLPEQL